MLTTGDEISFRVVRIKCWRLTTISCDTPPTSGCDNGFSNGTDNGKNPPETEAELELAFEYLVTKGDLKWITIRSKQAVLLSLTLQSMVDEMVFQKCSSNSLRNKSDLNTSASLHYNTSPSYSYQMATSASVGDHLDKESSGDSKESQRRSSETGNGEDSRLRAQLCNDDWKFERSDGKTVSGKGFKLSDDLLFGGQSSKVIQIDNRRNRIHYNANLVFNDIADDDL